MNEQNLMVRASDLDRICWEFLRELQVDMIACLSDEGGFAGFGPHNTITEDTGTGPVSPVGATDPSQWVFPARLVSYPPPHVSLSSTQEDEVVASDEQPLLWGLVDVRTAREIVEGLARDVLREAFRWANRRAQGALAENSPSAYRYEAYRRRYENRAKEYLDRAAEKLKGAVLRKKKRCRKTRTISTRANRRRRNPIPASGRLLYNGRRAYRAPVGRPALPKGVWIARYKARQAARKKTQRICPSIRKPVKVPQTKRPRPKRVLKLNANGPRSFIYEPDPSESDIETVMGPVGDITEGLA